MRVLKIDFQPVAGSQQSGGQRASAQAGEARHGGLRSCAAANYLRGRQASQRVARIGVPVAGKQRISRLRRRTDEKRDRVPYKLVVHTGGQQHAIIEQFRLAAGDDAYLSVNVVFTPLTTPDGTSESE